MHRSTQAPTKVPHSAHIPWTDLHTESDAAAYVWAALPEHPVTDADVEQFFREQTLAPCAIKPDIVYSYADGPRVPGSVVQAEWLIEFHLTQGVVCELLVEKRLLAP